MTRQEFLTLQLAALDALERKVLICGVYNSAGNRCAIGAVLRLTKLKKTWRTWPKSLCRRIIEINDLDPDESPAARFVRVRKWVAAQLGGES